jgi:hypothetical protein
MTNDEIRNLPYGTPIRAKKSVRCIDEYKYGGVLVFKRGGKFGIMTKKSYCTDFKADELELIPKKVNNE